MLIGLCGIPTSGKSEVASILVREHGFHLLDTKEILRKITSDITGDTLSSLSSSKGKEKLYLGLEQRKILGEVGLLLERLFGDDYLLRRCLEGIDPNQNIVVDGLRRDQSLFFKGKVIEVYSNRVSEGKYSFDEYNRSKISYKIDNSGSLSDLVINVNKMIGVLNA